MNTPKPYTYLIKFKPTGQYYYGSRTKNVRLGRLPEDDLMVKYPTSSKYIKGLIKQHGIDAFEWEVRKTFNTADEAAAWETRVLKRCKVLEDNCWLNKNIAGYIVPTEESTKKISEFHKGKAKSEEHRQKISAALTGKVRSKEHAEKLSKALKGKMSGVNNPMYGKRCTDERRRKISEANKGKVISDEHKRKISEFMKTDANPGKNKSAETRKKLSESLSGKKRNPRSEETKDKIAKSLKGKSRGPMSEEGKEKRSQTLKGRPKSEETTKKKSETLKALAANGQHHSTQKKTCPHCGTEMNRILYGRWHGDNCKQNPARTN